MNKWIVVHNGVELREYYSRQRAIEIRDLLRSEYPDDRIIVRKVKEVVRR